jgi:hypothetical protein
MDVTAIVKVLWPYHKKIFEALREGEPTPELRQDEINRQLAKLPGDPDEQLR